MSTETRSYSFGPFVLDPGRGILLRQGVRVPLTPRTIELIAVMVGQAGEVLDKDELIRRVWGTTVVEENNLARQISTLRKALGETTGSREYIATVPGIGYRFVALVAPVDHPVVAVEVPHRAEPFGWRPVFTSIGVALALVVLTALVMARRNTGLEESPVQRAIQQFTFGGSLQQDPAWSPDGKRIAFASDRLGSMDLWVQTIGDAEATRLTASPGREWQPTWSPDGRELAFRSEEDGGGLFVIASTGGRPRRIAGFGDRPQWSPTGGLILFSSSTIRTGARQLYAVGPDGGDLREVFATEVRPFIAGGWLNSVDASWHPDGRRISLWGRAGETWKFVTVPVAGGRTIVSDIPDEALRAIDGARLRLGRFVWARSGRMLYFEGQTGGTRNIWRVAVHPTTLAWTDAPDRMTTDVGDETDLTISPDGARLAFTVRSQRTRVWAFDFDPKQGRLTGGERALTAGSPGQIDVDTLPDGSRVAYRALRAGRNEVRELTTSSREDRVLLASSEWSPSSPRWSSDGRRLAYSRPSSARSAAARNVIAVLSPGEPNEQLITLPGDTTLRPSDWSTDGKTILGDCRAGSIEPMGICTVAAPMAGDNQPPRLQVLVRDAGKNLFGPRFSPDQRYVSFLGIDAKGSTTSQVWVAPIGGGPWIPITDGRSFDDKVRWSPDGRVLYFVSNRSGYLNLYGRRFDPSTGTPAGDVFPVTSFDTPRRGLPSSIAQTEFAISHRRLFLPLVETQADIWMLDHVDK